jgi:hypothetical protein
MRGNEELPAELKAIEAELAALTPQEARIDRARLLFAAGQASARRRAGRAARVWAAAFSAMTVVAASLLFALLVRPIGPALAQPTLAEVGAPLERTAPAGACEHVPYDAGVAGAEQSDAPAEAALADADHDTYLVYPCRYRVPETTSVLAAALFGASSDAARPIRPALGYRVVDEWCLLDDCDDAPPAIDRHSSPPKPREVKTYRELLKELTGNHG